MEPSRPMILNTIADRINEEQLPVRIRLYAHESSELTTPHGCQRIADHIRQSDLVITSHVLMDREVEPLVAAIRSNARSGAVVLGLSSAAPLMRQTSIGAFRFGKNPSGGTIPQTDAAADELKGMARLKKLMRGIAGDRDVTPYLKDMMRLAPKLLRLIPSGRMRDLRSYLESYLYFVELSHANARGMFLMLADRYHAPVAGRLTGLYAAPVVYPDRGLYHPQATELFGTRAKYDRWYKSHYPHARGTVGLLILRGNVILGETRQIDDTVQAFESRGLRVVPVFSQSFDYREAVRRVMFAGSGVDAIVSLTGFPLVGGHVRSDAGLAAETLSACNVPYLAPVALTFQTVEQWKDSAYGLNTLQVATNVALTELDGAIEPLVTGGMQAAGDEKLKATITERTDKMVRRVERWIALRKKNNADKKIAITIFSFPPGKGSVGTAAYLDVFCSLHNTLKRLEAEGYTVNVPRTPEQLMAQIVTGDDLNASITNALLNVAGKLSVADYRALTPHAGRAARFWGPPPGTLNTDGNDLLVYGHMYGNVFVGVQPAFGFEGDPMRLLFAKDATPHHGYLAYYTWIERVFGADAHLHFGTHGSLEFMPGKQVGLDADCWPDLMTGDLPNLYLYSLNNPSEGVIAKRRSLATLVSYMTPPLENAGLYRDLAALKDLITDYRTTAPDDPRRALTAEVLAGKVDQLHLQNDVPLPSGPDDDMDAFVGRLYGYLTEVDARLIPSGLHRVGSPPQREVLEDLLLAVSEYDRPEHGVRSLTGLLAESANHDYQNLYARSLNGEQAAQVAFNHVRNQARQLICTHVLGAVRESGLHKDVRHTLGYLRQVAAAAMEERELDAVIRGLGGGYIIPAVGADPVRTPGALPSGRNIHGLDPASVPGPVAIRNARRVVDMMLRKNLEETGRYPESVGMVLWGLDNIKTHGEAVAQAFALMGVEPCPDGLGRVTRLQVIPLAELGRPRIDVTVQASGIFRDLFGMQMDLLDQAARTVAQLDEPDEQNFIRRNAHRVSAQLNISFDQASTRVFSNASGAYGANVDYMVGASRWETRADLADLFISRKSFAYGQGRVGEPAGEVFQALAAGIDTTFQNLDSSEVGITDVDHYFEYLGGFTSVVERASGRRPTVLVADTTTARARVRTLQATVRLEARTKLLNPKWHQGMLKHGYQGVEEIRKRLDYTFGFSATADAVESWVYDQTFETYVNDPELRGRMEKLNPHAYEGLLRRLREAWSRGFWQATDQQLELLREYSNTLEDALEGLPVGE